VTKNNNTNGFMHWVLRHISQCSLENGNKNIARR